MTLTALWKPTPLKQPRSADSAEQEPTIAEQSPAESGDIHTPSTSNGGAPSTSALPNYDCQHCQDTSSLSTTLLPSVDDNPQAPPIAPAFNLPTEEVSNWDIGHFIQNRKDMKDDMKYRLLTSPYKPFVDYAFKNDIPDGKRCFRYAWLAQYAPWLAYSPLLKGALCACCIVFPQPVHRGYQGAFISTAFTKYHVFHEAAKNHMASTWHRAAQQNAEAYLSVKKYPEREIMCQLDKSVKTAIANNRHKIFPIVSTIVFCGTHDISLRGKASDSGNVHDLFDFRIVAGDTALQTHLETAAANARYTSVRTQNELIATCQNVLRRELVASANKSIGFAILADESADISGKEQLSLGVRFVDIRDNNPIICEEFLGFATLKEMNADAIADAILKNFRKFGLDMDKLLGQAYDGCSTMAGHINGVQAKIKMLHPKAAFFHCSSHRLNLAVNDVNSIPEIRNTIGTIKETINFFRESPKRRSLVPNVPLLSETRWTSKYKSIRVFSENFEDIFRQLETLASNASGDTQRRAHQLHCACTSATFLVCLVIIANYSALLEPVTQHLQAVQLDLLQVQSHVRNLQQVLATHRQGSERHFKEDIFAKVSAMAEKLKIDVKVPRTCGRSCFRPNPPFSGPEDYFRKVIFVPYMDSLISSLESRFSQENTVPFSLFALQPSKMRNLSRADFHDKVTTINNVYHIENFEVEAMTWFDFWSTNVHLELQDMGMMDLLPRTEFFPAVRHAILIALTLPPTTCTNERSFSTLRRVKTWLRSTMAEERLSGEYMY